MEPYSIKRTLLLVLLVSIALSAVFTIVLTSAILDHECKSVNCPICEIIKAAKCFLKTLKLTAFLIFLAFNTVIRLQTSKKCVWYNPNPFSQIVLKVRFNT